MDQTEFVVPTLDPTALVFPDYPEEITACGYQP